MACKEIYCCACQKDVNARLTTGKEVYSHRKDLSTLPFWKCDICKNFVGCHHKTAEPTKPLGNIPSPELKKARTKIHEMLDPLWKSGKFSRGDLYKQIADKLGREYHTGEIKTLEEVREVLTIIEELKG